MTTGGGGTTEKRGRGKVTIREGEEEEEGKEQGGRRKVYMRTGEKEAAKKKSATRQTIGQKHSGGKDQKTGEETNKKKMLTVGKQRFNF